MGFFTALGGMIMMAFLASRGVPEGAFVLAAIGAGAFVYRNIKDAPAQYPVSSAWSQPAPPPAKKSTNVVTSAPMFIPPSYIVALPNGRYIDARTGKRWSPPTG